MRRNKIIIMCAITFISFLVIGNIYIKAHDFIYNRTPGYKKFHEKIKKRVDEFGSDLNILEVPTTTGNLSNILQETQNVTTIDISESSLKAALKKNKFLKTCIFNAYEKIPFQDETFDCVVSTHILYFLKEKNNLLSEYYRVLKPNGYIIIAEFDGYNNLSKTMEIAKKEKGIFLWKTSDIFFNFINNVSSKQYLSLFDLKELIKSHDFNIIKEEKSFCDLSNIIIARKGIK